MKFNYEKAIAAGYTDQQIASFLSPKVNFNLENALSSGYQYEQIVPFLVNNFSEDDTSVLGQIKETAKGVPRGFANTFLGAGEGLAEMADAAANFVGYEDLIDSGEENELVRLAREGKEYINQTLGADERYEDKWLTKLGDAVGSFAGFFVPGGALKAVGAGSKLIGGSSLALATSSGAGEQAQRIQMARQQGIDVSQDQEDKAIGLGGLIGTSEVLAPLSLLKKFQRLPDKEANTFFSKISSAVKTGLAEGTQEATAGALQSAVEKYTYNESLPLGETLYDQVIEDASLGGAAGVIADLALGSFSRRVRDGAATEAEFERERQLRDAEEIRLAEDRQEVSDYVNQQDSTDPESVVNVEETLLLPAPEPIDILTSEDQVGYANNISNSLNYNFPTATSFTYRTNEVTDPETGEITGSNYSIVDQLGNTYGASPIVTREAAATVAGRLNDKLLDRTLSRSVKDTLETSPTSYDERSTETLLRIGNRVLNPRSNLITDIELNSAATEGIDTRVEEDRRRLYIESLPLDQALYYLQRGPQQNRAKSKAEMMRLLSPSQRINLRRRENGLPETKFFTVQEARRELKDSFGNLANKKFESPEIKEKIDALQNARTYLNAEISKNITPAQIQKLLNEKNIASDISSPEINALARSFVGVKSVADMNVGDRRVFFKKVQSLPRLDNATKLPVFQLKPFTNSQFVASVEAVNNTGDFSNETISESAQIKPEDPRYEDKIDSIRKELRKQKVIRSGKVPVFDRRVKAEAEQIPIAEEVETVIEEEVTPQVVEEVEEQLVSPDVLERIQTSLKSYLDSKGLKEVGVNVDYALRNVVMDADGNLRYGIRRRKLNDEYESAPRTELDRAFIKEEFVEESAEGFYSRDMNQIFLAADRLANFEGMTEEQMQSELSSILNHEMVHAMRNLDLWTESEWKILSNAAAKIKNNNGQTYLDEAKILYADTIPTIQAEEAVANLIRGTINGNTKIGGKPRSLINKMFNFFERIKNFLRGSGYKSFNDILADIESGVVGGRERGVVRTARRAQEEQEIQENHWAGDDGIMFSKTNPPENTVKAYKLFSAKASKPDEYFPLFVLADKSVPVGEWVTAKSGKRTKEGGVKSGIGELAYRPGWHAGDYASATHIGGKSRGKQGKTDYRKADQIWVEVEMADDVDWQSEANRRARIMNNGQPDVQTAHITDQIPKGGFYRYKTNPDMQGNWLIGGDMKINRVLSPEEVKNIGQESGIKDLPLLPELIYQEGLSFDDLGGTAKEELKKFYPEIYASMAPESDQAKRPPSRKWFQSDDALQNSDNQATNRRGNPLGINIRQDRDGTDYASLIASGQKTYESRESRSLDPYVGKRVGLVRTGAGPASLVGYAEVGTPIEVNESIFNELRDEHLVPKGSTFDIKAGQTKFLYPMSASKAITPQELPSSSRGIVARQISGDILYSRTAPAAVSNIFPTAKRRKADPTETVLVSDFQEYLKDDPFKKNMVIVKSYDDLRKDKNLRTDEQKAVAFVDHIKNNLLYLFDSVPPEVRTRSSKWYEGANKLMQNLADKHGIDLSQASALAANLSPQKDWYMNASLAERTADIFFEKASEPFTPEMEKKAKELYVDGKAVSAKKKVINKKILDRIKGKSLSDLIAEGATFVEQAMWIRTYDQTYNSPSYRIVSPEGDYLQYAKTKAGNNSRVAWGSFGEIAKGIKALSDPDLKSISSSLGEANKVRNFYNNIYDPSSELGFVTIDTHAVGAGLLRPVSGDSDQVSANFGTLKGSSSSSKTGYRGTYPFYEEAYKQAAAERGVLPREMQSITWEAVRGLFSPSYKANESNVKFVNGVWKDYNRKKIDLDEARERILNHAGRITNPDWTRPDSGSVAEDAASSYESQLPSSGVPGQTGQLPAGGGRRGDVAAATTDESNVLAAQKSEATNRESQRFKVRNHVDVLESRRSPGSIASATTYENLKTEAENRAYNAGDYSSPMSFETPTYTYQEAGLAGPARGFLYQVADKLIGLKSVEESINKKRRDSGLKEIPTLASPYKGEERVAGIVGGKIRDFDLNQLRPFVEAMVDNNVDRKEMDDFLILRHAVERNARIKSINPAIREAGAGMLDGQALTDTYVKSKMASLYGMQWNDTTGSWTGGNSRAQVLNSLASTFDGFTKGTLKELRDGGLISSQDFNTLSRYYKYYAPLKGKVVEDDVSSELSQGSTGIGGSYTIVGQDVKTAMGRQSEAFSPLSTAIADRERAVVRSTKNKQIGENLVGLIRDNPNPEFWEVIDKDNPVYKRAFKTRYVYAGKDPSIPVGTVRSDLTGVKDKNAWFKKKIVEPSVSSPILRNDLLGVKIDGEQVYIDIRGDERLKNSLMNLDADTMNFLTKSLSKASRFLSYVNTSLNPEFVVGNFARDIQTAINNIIGEQTMVGGKALNTKGLKRGVIKDTVPSIKDFYKGYRNSKNRTAQQTKDFDEYINSGAKTDWFVSRAPDQVSSTIDNLIEMQKGTFAGNFKKRYESIRDFVDDTNSAVENGVRFATFKKARDLFVDNNIPRDEAIAQAATLAKNLTVNFNRKGEAGNLLNSLYIFFNASVQGTANFARGLNVFDPESSRSKQAMVGSMIGFGALMAYMNSLLSDDDEDSGRSYYSAIPAFEKERNIIIMKSIFNPDAPPNQYHKIPLPYGYNVFHVLGTSIMDSMTGSQSKEEAAASLVTSSIGSFSPVGFGSSENYFNSIARGITPTVAQPIVEILANEDYFGGPVYSESQYGQDIPASQMAFRSTPEVFKRSAKFLNAMTRGDESTSGILDFSPDTMNHMFQFALGGTGAFAIRSMNALEKGLTGLEITPNEVPFYRRIVGEVSDFDQQTDFYDRKDKLDAKYRQSKIETGADRGSYVRKNKNFLRLRPVMNNSETRIRALNKRLELLQSKAANSTIDAITFAREQEKIQDDKAKIYKQFNRKYDSLIGRLE